MEIAAGVEHAYLPKSLLALQLCSQMQWGRGSSQCQAREETFGDAPRNVLPCKPQHSTAQVPQQRLDPAATQGICFPSTPDIWHGQFLWVYCHFFEIWRCFPCQQQWQAAKWCQQLSVWLLVKINYHFNASGVLPHHQHKAGSTQG